MLTMPMTSEDHNWEANDLDTSVARVFFPQDHFIEDHLDVNVGSGDAPGEVSTVEDPIPIKPGSDLKEKSKAVMQ